MKRLTIALAALLAAPAFAADEPNLPVVEQVRVALSVDDPRPLAAAILELEYRHGVPITYEDAPIVVGAEMKDVTTEVRHDLSRYAPGQAPKVIIPLGGTFTIFYNVASDTGQPASMRDVLQSAIDAHAGARLAGRYRVLESGAGFSVVPSAHTGADARLSAVAPVLDTRITLAGGARSGIDAIEQICRAVSVASGEAVTIGTAPATVLGRHTTTISAADEPAREVLARLLKECPVAMSWQLFHDPADGFYALNLHSVR